MEFALVALLLFGILFTIIDLGIMFYVNLTMQHAVREGTRYAVTGQMGGQPKIGYDTKDQGQFKWSLRQEPPCAKGPGN